MATAFVNAGNGAVTGATPTLTGFTCNAGSEVLIAVLVTNAGATVSNATYGGVAMQRPADASIVNGTTCCHIAYLYSPTTGVAGDIVFNVSTGSAGRIIAQTFSDVDEAFTPVVAESSGTSATPSVSLTPTRSDGAIVSGVCHEGAAAMTGRGANQTAVTNTDEGTFNTATSRELAPAAGTSTSHTYTNAASDVWSAAAIFVAPAAAPAAGAGSLGLLGVG